MVNGVELYDKEFLDKINTMIEKSENKEILKGFHGYMISATKAKSMRTRYNYLYRVNVFLEQINKEVTEITFQDLSIYMSGLEYKENGTKYTQGNKIIIYTALKHFFDFLYKSKVIEENPMNDISRPIFGESQETIKKRDNNYLDSKEIQTYLDTVSRGAGSYLARARQEEWKDRDKLMIMLFLTTGIRCSALRNLDVDNIDLENKTLIVTDKGDKSKIRSITDSVIQVAEEWLKKRNELLGDNKENALFISNRKTRMSKGAIDEVIKKYSGYIDGKKISPHKLRATYGTMLYNKTKDLYFVQEMMGHSSPKTTELYVRGNSENDIMAANIMEDIVGGF